MGQDQHGWDQEVAAVNSDHGRQARVYRKMQNVIAQCTV